MIIRYASPKNIHRSANVNQVSRAMPTLDVHPLTFAHKHLVQLARSVRTHADLTSALAPSVQSVNLTRKVVKHLSNALQIRIAHHQLYAELNAVALSVKTHVPVWCAE